MSVDGVYKNIPRTHCGARALASPQSKGAAGNELVKIVMQTCMLSTCVTKKIFYGISLNLAPLWLV
jgi:hypothetical protein